MSAFAVLWWVVAAYQVVEVARAVRALILTPGTRATFGWPFLILAAANTSLGTLYLTGAIR